MKADLKILTGLIKKGLVMAHNAGPDPKTVVRLFKTKPEIWTAELLELDISGVTHFSIPTIYALEKNGADIQDSDLKKTISILGKHFFSCDSIKIQAGQEFGGKFKNIPPMIFLWWD